MKILVTGATGFVGKHLVPKLLENGFDVTCLVRSKEKAYELKKDFNVEIIIGDITKVETLKGLSDGIDYVVHLAAMGHVSSVTEESFNHFVSINEEGTENLVSEFAGSTQLKKFIHFSSTAAMGYIKTPIQNEKSITNPVTPYQKSKNRSELIVNKAYEQNNFPSMIIRPCMIYGPGGYGEFYKFCKLMKKGIFPKVGLGLNLTPLVFVEDVVMAVIQAIRNGQIGNTYIIASEKSIPMDELHDLIMKSMGKKAPYIYIPVIFALIGAKLIEVLFPMLGKEPPVSYQNIKSTITDRTFDISKAVNDLGYQQRFSFEKGIEETIKWYKSQNKL